MSFKKPKNPPRWLQRSFQTGSQIFATPHGSLTGSKKLQEASRKMRKDSEDAPRRFQTASQKLPGLQETSKNRSKSPNPTSPLAEWFKVPSSYIPTIPPPGDEFIHPFRGPCPPGVARCSQPTICPKCLPKPLRYLVLSCDVTFQTFQATS